MNIEDIFNSGQGQSSPLNSSVVNGTPPCQNIMFPNPHPFFTSSQQQNPYQYQPLPLIHVPTRTNTATLGEMGASVDMLRAQLMELSKRMDTMESRFSKFESSVSNDIFLNEQCKDAINLSDFVKSLEITFENLKIVNQTGMEESVSALILKGLENMDVSKRPIHCTDQKRDVMYVKEEEKWEKDEGNDKLKSSIDDISRRHAYTLKKFKDVNPDIKVGHAMHDDFIQTMNRICTPIEDPGKKRIVKQVGKNVTMNAQIANNDDDECEPSSSLM